MTSKVASLLVLDDLIRLVVRAFYSDEQVLVTEVLLKEHKAITEEDIGRYLKLTARQVRKALKAMEVDYLVKSTIRKEDKNKENGDAKDEVKRNKWNQLTWWYFDYKQFVDIVKYRIHMMQKAVEQDIDRQIRVQMYNCPKCGTNYSALDAQKLINMETGLFQCERCKSELEEFDNSAKVHEAQQRLAAMRTQLRPIIKQLQETSKIIIPNIELKLTQATTQPTSESSSSTYLPGFEVQISFEDAGNANKAGANKPKTKDDITSNNTVVDMGKTAKELPPWLRSAANEPQKAQQTSSATPIQRSQSIEASKEEQDRLMKQYLSYMTKQETATTPPDGAMEAEISKAVEEQEEEEEESAQEEEPVIKVGDRMVPLSEITEEDKGQMTEEEYNEYWKKIQENMGWG